MNNNFILLVEDNPDDVVLTLRSFKKSNIVNEIVVVRDGAEALDFLFAREKYATREKAIMPSLILLDLKLPKIDGIEVLKQIRSDARTELIPVVILTSSTEERDIVNSYKFRCNSYVRKPVSFDEFTQAAKQLGLYWLILNEPPNLLKD